MAYINVTAPSGATITITNGDRIMTATGDHIFAVSVLGAWTVTCVYEGISKTVSVDIQGYGEAWMVEFTFSAYIVVRTSAGADVTASKTGEEDLTGTADENGICQLTVPLTGIGEWQITSELDDWSNTATLTIPELDDIYSIDVLLSAPQFKFTPTGDSAVTITEDTASFHNSNMRYVRSSSSWYLYLFVNGTLECAAPVLADVFAIGAGANGNHSGQSLGHNTYGGKYKTLTDQTIYGQNTVTIGQVNWEATTIGDITTEDSTKYRRYGSSTPPHVYAFEDSTATDPTGSEGYAFGGYGGAGGYVSNGSGYAWQSGTSGVDGGGQGGDASRSNSGVASVGNGTDASRYGSGGGMGGAAWQENPHKCVTGTGGKGYKGFVGLRST